jgi:hypothetical protein
VSAFSAIARDALRDAARRRGLVAAAVASAIAALAVARCGHCEAAVSVQGQTLSTQAGELAVVGAIASIALIALWTYAVAALLASDGLAAALEDGVAEAVLARPVSRDTFVLARLAGAWSGAFALGAALLALALGLAADQPGVTLLPALRALLCVGVAAWSVAALAMCVSLSLPRAATLLLSGALGPWWWRSRRPGSSERRWAASRARSSVRTRVARRARERARAVAPRRTCLALPRGRTRARCSGRGRELAHWLRVSDALELPR